MNRCADRPLRTGLTLALSAGLLLAACAPQKAVRPTKPTPAVPTPAAEPVKPADRGDPQARFAQALELMKQKKAKEAETEFLALSKDFPEFSGPQTNLGILLAKSNRRDQAIAAFTRAATANGGNASAFNWLGVVNREAGQFERARESYEKAISVKPDYAAPQLNLGLLLEDHLKRPADALPHYREYLRLTGGKDLRVLPWIAEIEAKLPKPAAAVPAASATVPAEKEIK